MKKIYPVAIALLGVLVGALLVLTFDKLSSRKPLKAGGTDWKKVNLILDYVDANYVDSIDYDGVTEAAVKAALAKLDPHSVYMRTWDSRSSMYCFAIARPYRALILSCIMYRFCLMLFSL